MLRPSRDLSRNWIIKGQSARQSSLTAMDLLLPALVSKSLRRLIKIDHLLEVGCPGDVLVLSTIFNSSAPASAMNLFLAAISWRGTGSDSRRGRATASMARRGALSSLRILSDSGKSTHAANRSSMKTSEHPLSSTGKSNTNSLASAIGTSSSRNSGAGSSRDC
eukprot:scaffold5629_cov48-Cyclotella_meneghiniana.AAC.8